MAHIQLVVDGQEILNDHIDEWQAPPTLAAVPIPNEPPKSLPVQVKPLLLLALGKAMHRALNEGPLLQPVATELITRSTGFTLSADITPTNGQP